MAELKDVPSEVFAIVTRFLSLIESDSLLMTCKTIARKLYQRGVTHVTASSVVPSGLFSTFLPKIHLDLSRLASRFPDLESLRMRGSLSLSPESTALWRFKLPHLTELDIQVAPSLSDFFSTLAMHRIVLHNHMPSLTILRLNGLALVRTWPFGMEYFLATLPRSITSLTVTVGTQHLLERLKIDMMSCELPPGLVDLQMKLFWDGSSVSRPEEVAIASSLGKRSALSAGSFHLRQSTATQSHFQLESLLPSSLASISIDPAVSDLMKSNGRPLIFPSHWRSIEYSPTEPRTIQIKNFPNGLRSLHLNSNVDVHWSPDSIPLLKSFTGREVPEFVLPHLKSLIISKSENLAFIPSDLFPHLVSLSIPKSQLLQSAYEDLLCFSTLQSLCLLTLKNLENIANFGIFQLPSSLTSLEVLQHGRLTCHFTDTLARCCTQLKRLELHNTHTVEANAFWHLSALSHLEILCIEASESQSVNVAPNPADTAYMPSVQWAEGVISSLPPNLTRLRLDWCLAPETVAAVLKLHPNLRELDLRRFSFPISALLEFSTHLNTLMVESIALTSIIETFLLKEAFQQLKTICLNENLHIIVPPDALTLPHQYSAFDMLENPLDLIWGDTNQKSCPVGNRSESEDDAIIRKFFADNDSFEAIHSMLQHFKFSSCRCMGNQTCRTKWPFGFLVVNETDAQTQ